MTMDLDDLKLEAKKLGIKGVHLFKSAEKIQAAIDEAKANGETPAEPEPFTKQPPKEEAAPITPDQDAPVKVSPVLMACTFNGSVHKVWVASDKINEWSDQGYQVVG